MPVPSDAAALRVGVSLRGSGVVRVRGLRLRLGPALDDDGPIDATARAVLDAALDTVAQHALHRDVLTERRRAEVRTLASGAMTPRETYPAIQSLLSVLEDGHSSFMSPGQWKAYVSDSDSSNTSASVSAAAEGHGYIDLPSYSGGTVQEGLAYARALQEKLTSVAPQARCGWILDLRSNQGGNVYPMLAAMKPFLGEIPRVRAMGPDGPINSNSDPDWETVLQVQVPGALKALSQAPVAVLVGSKTASSGEALALRFRGRQHARSFGASTAGFTTANRTFRLPDDSRLVLAVGAMIDASGAVQRGKIEPDEVTATAGLDRTLSAATAWLASRAGCAANGYRDPGNRDDLFQ